jgi:hypothetical protein
LIFADLSVTDFDLSLYPFSASVKPEHETWMLLSSQTSIFVEVRGGKWTVTDEAFDRRLEV